ncbi:MAG: ribosome small subunit-dependent GTPase A [Phycisphaerae bacterium]|nr:ribosome small subunit-dependent GTPase A [Phycisphaerae bacterium]
MSKGKGKGGSSKKGPRKVRVHFRANRLTPKRDKGWTQWFKEGRFEREDETGQERLNRKGDLSRKRTVIQDEDGQATVAPGNEQREGIVLAMRGQIADIDDGQRTWPCTLRRILRTRTIEERHPLAVGDRVSFTVVADEEGVEREGVIESVAERKGQLSRRYGDREHTIAANVDQVVIVGSIILPFIKPHLIDRYLVAASIGELHPVVCINKVDLDREGLTEEFLDRFRQLGVDTLATSAVSGQGMAALSERLKDRVSVLAGQSGTGKSSLLNAIQPDLRLRVAEVSSDNFKGRHTTTTAQLLKLDMGGYVVDTPGIRQFEMTGIEPGELEAHFPDFEPHLSRCKYPDCAHTNEGESDCGVKQAVTDGRIHFERYESYLRMLDELIQLDGARQTGQSRTMET